MNLQTSVEIAGHRLPVVIERVDGRYQATSPVLDGFLVLADTRDEVLALAPGVARALLEAMQAKGMHPLYPTRSQPLSLLDPLIGSMPAGGDALKDSEALYDKDW